MTVIVIIGVSAYLLVPHSADGQSSPEKAWQEMTDAFNSHDDWRYINSTMLYFAPIEEKEIRTHTGYLNPETTCDIRSYTVVYHSQMSDDEVSNISGRVSMFESVYGIKIDEYCYIRANVTYHFSIGDGDFTTKAPCYRVDSFWYMDSTYDMELVT